MERGNDSNDVDNCPDLVSAENAAYSMEDKTVLIINVDTTVAPPSDVVNVSSELAGHEVDGTVAAGVEQAEVVSIYPNQSSISTEAQYVFTSEGAYSSAVYGGTTAGQVSNEITTVAVTLPPDEHIPSDQPTSIMPTSAGAAAASSSITHQSAAVSVSGVATSTDSLTSAAAAAVAAAAAAGAMNSDHSHGAAISSVAITNAQIVTARACPATVQWLIENFETAEGISLPRSTLYHFYLRHCSGSKVDAVNAASFGKLIRSVFLGLRTRRLGTRGNSKYHYYGIRIKPTSPLSELPIEDYTPQSQRSRYRTPTKDDGFLSHSFSTPSAIATPSSTGKANPLRHEPHPAVPIVQPTEQQQEEFQNFLSLSLPLPALPDLALDSEPLPDGITQENMVEFVTLYKEHCEELVNVIRNFQFHLLAQLWKQFWSQAEGSNGAAATDTPMDTGDDAHHLPAPILQALCRSNAVQMFVKSCDNIVYQSLVEILVPEVLRPIPGHLTQIIRNLSKNLETWLRSSMVGVAEPMAEIKMTAVSALSQTLRRYTSLNHLAQAARSVLQNPSQISNMLSDLMKVDFASIQEQASWVCQCKEETLLRVQSEFKSTLQTHQPLEDWANWMEKLVDEFLLPVTDTAEYVKVARQFILKWSFYSSMVIRDLTLRSAASFGSFHLIRLLYDEFMFYIIEHRVAKALGQVPIAILGEFVELGRLYSSQHDESGFNDDTMAELNPQANDNDASQEHVIVPLMA